MRVIEKQLINEARDFFNYFDSTESKNLSVRDRIEKYYFKDSGNKRFEYKLWDSSVFIIDRINGIYSVAFCFHGYMTNTTKSRINAFLWEYLKCSVSQKNYELYLNDSNGNKTKINVCDFYQIDNNPENSLFTVNDSGYCHKFTI